MQLARTLAQTVGRVQDSFMRGEVVSKASARLGVTAAEFESSFLNRRANIQESQKIHDHPALLCPA